jgi:ribosomal protein S18 acetylase RimI-like enzyme
LDSNPRGGKVRRNRRLDIRALVESDAAVWWALRGESLEYEPYAFGRALDEHRATTVEAVAQRFRDAPAQSFHLGAFVYGDLIGMATFIREAGQKERHKGRVFGVYVTPAQRGKGVGRALLAPLVERAERDPSLEQILISVSAGQHAAKRLYRSFGFTIYGTEPNALKVGAAYVDEDHMIRRIRRTDGKTEEEN